MEPRDGARSALVRRALDQLKPSPRCRLVRLDISFWGNTLLVFGAADPEEVWKGKVLADSELRRPSGMREPGDGFLPSVLPPCVS